MNSILLSVTSLKDKDGTITPKEEDKIITHFIAKDPNDTISTFINAFSSCKTDSSKFCLCRLLNTIYTKLPSSKTINWSSTVEEAIPIITKESSPLLHSSKTYKIIKLLPSILEGTEAFRQFNTVQRRRIFFLKQMEADRKLFKNERASLWKVGPGDNGDYLSFVNMMTAQQQQQLLQQQQTNVQYYNEINSIKEQRAIFDISLLPRAPSYIVEELVTKLLFGDDFDSGDFDQPHWQYYWKEDDMISLASYDFDKDALGSSGSGSRNGGYYGYKRSSTATTTTTRKTSTPKYRERSYRFRRINEIYSSGDLFITKLGKHYGDGIRRLREDLTEVNSFFSSINSSIIMSFESGYPLVELIANAMILGLNRAISCSFLFCSSKYGVDWTLKYCFSMFDDDDRMNIFISKKTKLSDDRFISIEKIKESLHYL